MTVITDERVIKRCSVIYKFSINWLIGSKLREIRKKTKIKISEMAAELKISPKTLLKFEYGLKGIPGCLLYKYLQLTNPSDETMFFFCSFNQSTSDLYLKSHLVLYPLYLAERLLLSFTPPFFKKLLIFYQCWFKPSEA